MIEIYKYKGVLLCLHSLRPIGRKIYEVRVILSHAK
jgi:hypothetical protein